MTLKTYEGEGVRAMWEGKGISCTDTSEQTKISLKLRSIFLE